MPLKYWRTILIASALGVCGLAVWASDPTPGEKPAVPMRADPPVPLPGPAKDAAKDDAFPSTTAAEPSPENEPPKKAPPPITPPSPADQPNPAAPSANGSYKLHVRMGGNLGPRFEVRDGDALLLKVYCEHIDMQGSQHGSTAIPGLTATGQVRF